MYLAPPRASTLKFPRRYKKDYLMLLVQDPYNLYSYWEITNERLAMAANLLQQDTESLAVAVRLLIREAGKLEEVARHKTTNSCGHRYFSGFPTGRTYIAELGVPQAGGGFLTLLSSDEVCLGVENERQKLVLPAFPTAFFHRS